MLYHLHRLILDRSNAIRDDDHLLILHLSLPAETPDRTGFLLGDVKENPAASIPRQIELLFNVGAYVIGLLCNTAHPPSIYNSIFRNKERFENLIMVNMIEELFRSMRNEGIKKVGLLCTLGSYRTKLFEGYAKEYDIQVVVLDPEAKERYITLYTTDMAV